MKKSLRNSSNPVFTLVDSDRGHHSGHTRGCVIPQSRIAVEARESALDAIWRAAPVHRVLQGPTQRYPGEDRGRRPPAHVVEGVDGRSHRRRGCTASKNVLNSCAVLSQGREPEARTSPQRTCPDSGLIAQGIPNDPIPALGAIVGGIVQRFRTPMVAAAGKGRWAYDTVSGRYMKSNAVR